MKLKNASNDSITIDLLTTPRVIAAGETFEVDDAEGLKCLQERNCVQITETHVVESAETGLPVEAKAESEKIETQDAEPLVEPIVEPEVQPEPEEIPEEEKESVKKKKKK